jgi:hypothetical protein
VKAIGQAIGGSPAALLAGSNDIEKDFRITAGGTENGLEWVEAEPRSSDSTFQKVRLGFGKSGLEAMELLDGFGQRTVVRFDHIERNPKLPPDLFQFTPPKGADVISELSQDRLHARSLTREARIGMHADAVRPAWNMVREFPASSSNSSPGERGERRASSGVSAA